MELESLKVYLLDLIDRQAAEKLPATKPFHAPKLEEARDVLDQADDPSLVKELNSLTAKQLMQRYPMLSASIGIDGNSIIEVAKSVHNSAMQARQVTLIELIRKTGREAVKTATSKEEAEQAYRFIRWGP